MDRILHVFVSLDRGGAETRVIQLYEEIDRECVQFDFVVMSPGEHSYDSIVATLGGRKFRVRHPGSGGIVANFIDLFRLLRRQGPFRAVHAHTLHHSGLVLLAARLAGVKYRIAHARNTSTPPSRNPLNRLFIFIGRLLIITNATSLLAISPEAARYLYGDRIVARGKAIVVPNAINLAPYRGLCDDDNLRLREHLHIPANALVMGCVARFDYQKNHELLIAVLSHIREYGEDARLVLVGDGERRKIIEEMARERGLDRYISFLGIREDIALLNRMFDVNVMPSFFEGLGGAAIEAQAAGTPCVLSTGLPPCVDMGLGLVEFLPLTDAKAWAQAVRRQARRARVDFPTVLAVFERRGFSIEKERQMFMTAYGLKE